MNSKGYSLVELMVALFLISGVALIISQFSASYNSKQSTLRRACESYTESLVGLVKEETPYRQILNFTPPATSATARIAPDFASETKALALGSYKATGSASAHYQINNPSPDGLHRGTRLQSFQLIQGSVRTLAEIYNRTPAIRCNYTNYARLAPNNPNSLPIPSSFLSLPAQGNTDISFRIEPFDTSTGASSCRPLAFPRPPGLLRPHENAYVPQSGSPLASTAYNSAYSANDETDGYSPNDTVVSGSLGANSTISDTNTVGGGAVGDPNLGMRFSVRMTYELDGTTYSCVSSQDFTYPVDRTPPEQPDLNIIYGASNNSVVAASPGLWDHCDASGNQRSNNTGEVIFRVGYTSAMADSEPGVQFACKDLSWIREPNDTRHCFTGSGSFAHPYFSSMTMDTTNTESNNQFPFSSNIAPREKGWVPCYALKQCGQSPTTVVPRTTGGANYYELSYTTLPFGCLMNFEVVAIDTAGNRSTVTNPTFLDWGGFAGSSVTINSQTFRPRRNEIYHPTCGNEDNDYYIGGLGTFCPNLSSVAGAIPGSSPAADDWHWGSWETNPRTANGYYTCRASCCEGLGCSPSSM